MNAPVLERTLRIAPAFQARNTGNTGSGPVAAELSLQHARVPQTGGDYAFYLVDPSSHSPIMIGDLAVVGPTYQKIGTVHVYVELSPRALAVLRENAAPKVRIVQRRQGGEPLIVQSVELHATS
ncbi:MAG: hypothetical protein QOJ39_3982 [Candidatus Eremiobacteraeota bacterium]|nr:hypothetical protein [Candidatus Eremiobacteraeota bacterium]